MNNIVNIASVKSQPQKARTAVQEKLVAENLKLIKEIKILRKNLKAQAEISNLFKAQVKEIETENEILLNALGDDDIEVPLLTTPTLPGSMNGYWEQEYRLLKEKIRHVEQSVLDKDTEIEAAQSQNEKLLNELLSK